MNGPSASELLHYMQGASKLTVQMKACAECQPCRAARLLEIIAPLWREIEAFALRASGLWVIRTASRPTPLHSRRPDPSPCLVTRPRPPPLRHTPRHPVIRSVQ